MRYVVHLTALLGCLLIANSPACGESVYLHLSIGCNRDFAISLSQQAPGDGGIASYSIDLVGVEQADAFVQVVLRSGEPVAGFTIGGEDLDGDGTLFASQDLDARGSILWGLGTRGSMPVAAGTFAGADGFDLVRSASVDVFTRRGVTETVSADVEVAISIPICALMADYNGNGLVEQADLDLVLGNWGADAEDVPATWQHDLPVGIVDQGSSTRSSATGAADKPA